MNDDENTLYRWTKGVDANAKGLIKISASGISLSGGKSILPLVEDLNANQR